MNIAVDFDGTLCEDRYPEIGAPKPEVIGWVRRQMADGHHLVLWTLRTGKLLEEAWDWARNHGIFFDAVLQKPNMDIFLDDKNMRAEDVRRFEAHSFVRG